MKIVFYEKEYCEDILKNGVDKLHRRDLNYLAKYWDYLGYGEKDIEDRLIEFCKKNDENFNEIQNYDFIHRAMLHSRNNQLRFPTPIQITKSEIYSIQTYDDYKIQKFLFIMLVVAKFFKYHQSRKNPIQSKYDQYLYSNTPIRELKNLAHINFTRNEWNDYKYQLTKAGLITPTIVGATKWAIGYWNEFSPAEMMIKDYRNPIVYYKEYCGESLVECVECGMKISRRSSTHSYCRDCWRNVSRRQTRERVKKYRKNNIM